jgi:hypothetical protein
VIRNQASRLLLNSTARMIIFLLSRILGVLLGLAVGAVIAVGASAGAGVFIGVILAISVGFLVGSLPHEIALVLIRLVFKWRDKNKLRAQLESDYWLSHLIIAELVSRGEPVEQFRGYVESLLRSDSAFRRSYGKMNRRKWFPDMKP